MTNKDLFKEAIADAKAVREAALVNAKAALEEAFAPKLQSMISAKLQEMEEDEMEEEDELEENVDNYMDEEEMYESKKQLAFVIPCPDAYDIDEEVEHFQYLLDKAGVKAKVKANEVGEEAEVYTEDEKKARKVIEKNGYQIGWNEDDNLEEMEEGFLGARAEFDNENPDFNLFEDEEEEDELEEDFDLSEILAELDGEEEDELEEAKKKKKKKSDEDSEEKNINKEKKQQKKVAPEKDENDYGYSLDEEKEEDEDDAKISSLTVSELKDLISDIIHGEMEHEENETPSDEEHEPEHGGEKDQDEVDLEELLAELDEMEEDEMEKAKIEPHGYKPAGKYKNDPKSSEELNEAIKTINTLRRELNEQNLLNAKLLYVNKIFKAKNLTESQKLRVIASFDKATTAKEAKMVFESLNTTLKTNAPKNSLKESMGFASKASGVAPKKAIVESDDVITRMQKLANIIK